MVLVPILRICKVNVVELLVVPSVLQLLDENVPYDTVELPNDCHEPNAPLAPLPPVTVPSTSYSEAEPESSHSPE